MTCKEKYVILSASEISHDHSDKVYALRKLTLPGDCFVATLPRKDKKHVILSAAKKLLKNLLNALDKSGAFGVLYTLFLRVSFRAFF